jgi:hypothetical protein
VLGDGIVESSHYSAAKENARGITLGTVG